MVSGSICALVTPFADDDALDLDALARLIEWHVEAGTDALVLAGSTGESVALEETELRQLWQRAADSARGRIGLIAGTGAPSTRRSARLTRIAQECGMHAALVVTPAYVRPTQEGLYQHYAVVAAQGLPVLLYNVPARTACDLLPSTVQRLLELPAVVGIKEAVADPERIDALLRLQSIRRDFVVLSGDDPTALMALGRGADGVISVAANVVPRQFARLVAMARAGELREARTLDQYLQPLFTALGCEPNPIPVKTALARLGLIGGHLRLPLTPLAAAHLPLLDQAVAASHEPRPGA
ncbi:MAG: 4-hydroxy-tetrahydrodipicolinate synthase [Xanthomonadales bacterium]|jgi:4-hydroxy-tetrahydrodipicolinate synthase|nr:4-hydroxy-tetrahydrodipicolinate synthase [Xanthomonadales bacterium]